MGPFGVINVVGHRVFYEFCCCGGAEGGGMGVGRLWDLLYPHLKERDFFPKHRALVFWTWATSSCLFSLLTDSSSHDQQGCIMTFMLHLDGGSLT